MMHTLEVSVERPLKRTDETEPEGVGGRLGGQRGVSHRLQPLYLKRVNFISLIQAFIICRS